MIYCDYCHAPPSYCVYFLRQNESKLTFIYTISVQINALLAHLNELDKNIKGITVFLT
jgi:hypothetical protein